MKLRDLLTDPNRRRFAAQPEMDALMDALRESDALQEAQLQDVRFEVVSGTLWVLFDCRGALQIEEGNTAVVVARGVSALHWHGPPYDHWRAWPVVESVIGVHGRDWSLSLSLLSDARLAVTARAAEFWVGDAPGCDEAPPDFTADDDVTIRNGLASWESEFQPSYSVFLDSDDSDAAVRSRDG
jgi:hypothetical protein